MSDDDTSIDVLKAQLAMRDAALDGMRNELAETRSQRDQALLDVARWTARVKWIEGKLEAIRGLL